MILLREWREKRGMTQAELSRASGVPQQTISSIETEARSNPRMETLFALCGPLGCAITDLVKTDRQGERT